MALNQPTDLDRLRQWTIIDVTDRQYYLDQANRWVTKRASVIPADEQAEVELLLAAHLACFKEPYPADFRTADVSMQIAAVPDFGELQTPFGARLIEKMKGYKGAGFRTFPTF